MAVGTWRSRLFYGWIIVAALFTMVLFTSGVRFATGPFLKPMAEDLGVGRGPVSLIIAVGLFMYGAMMPITGRLIDRFGPRPIMASSALLMAGALVGSAFATNYWQILLLWGFLSAAGFAGTSQVTAMVVCTNWFARYRGTATSIIAAAAMGSMAIFTPVITYIILQAGWRGAFLALAAPMIAVILPLALWVVKGRPEDMGLRPDGDPPPAPGIWADSRTAAAPSGPKRPAPIPVVSFLRTRPFWALAGSFFTCGYSMNLLTTHGQPMLTDHGFSPMLAASAVGVLGAFSFGGAVAIGALSDRIGRRGLLALIYIVRSAGFALLLLTRDPVTLYILAAVAGIFWSGTAALTSSLTADIYGRSAVGTVFGTVFLSHQIGASLSSYSAGLIFDLTGSYTIPFLITSAVLLFGAYSALQVAEKMQIDLSAKTPRAAAGHG